MWLFTSFGFFSIVQKAGDEHLTVRSRTQGDLLRLRRHYLPALTPPSRQGGSDYPWRSTCTHAALAEALPRIVQHLTYDNFKSEVKRTLGAAREARYAKVWEALHSLSEDLVEHVSEGFDDLPWPDEAESALPVAYGGVVIDRVGRVLLREVANHYDGYRWSFAKGRANPGEHPRRTALREVEEELGVEARLLLPLPGEFAGGTSSNRYFLMLADVRHSDPAFRSDETAAVRWVWPAEARALLAETTNAAGLERDLAVLEAALAMLPEVPPLKRSIAMREDLSTRPFPALRRSVRADWRFTTGEMARIVRGFVPAQPEERWFAVFEDAVLSLSRSGSGLPLYRVHFTPDDDGATPGWRAFAVDLNRHPEHLNALADEGDELRFVRAVIDTHLLDLA
jgi:8-oxo-dGTP pyrophosphatase MutT (NUDIX family)